MTRVSARRLIAKAAREVAKASRHGIWMSRPGIEMVIGGEGSMAGGRDEVVFRWKVSWDELDAFFIYPTNQYLGRLRQSWTRRLPKTRGHVPPGVTP